MSRESALEIARAILSKDAPEEPVESLEVEDSNADDSEGVAEMSHDEKINQILQEVMSR